MDLEERSRLRKKKMVAHCTEDHDDAELWDLMFWQSLSPEDRLSALVHIHKDVQTVNNAKKRTLHGNNSRL